MKFLSTCSQMSFQKYTWIKERQLPNSATAHFGGQKSQFFWAVSPAGSSPLVLWTLSSISNQMFASVRDKCSLWKCPRPEEPKDPGCAGSSGCIPGISAESALFWCRFTQKTPQKILLLMAAEPADLNPFFSLSRPDRPFKGQALSCNIYRIFMLTFILQ